jgi:sterol desaturase/sphingolipid hydroxylase (fatty acid hydroxylase superfamily)
MNLNPVILAIPMYFTLMGIELVYENITKRKTYRLNDAITNISTGTLQQLTNTFVAVVRIGIYTFIYEHWALFNLEQNWVTFSAAMILFDFFFYWEHRMAHTISLFWGGHVVHHQSEDFNLSVALRQTSTGFIWGFPFFLPMAIMGFHPMQFVLVGGLNLLYQFWIHTEHINKLPKWFEFVFNTPSHHRVHHGRDPKYIDKNYAGIFIFWDRIFGTFTKEEERPNYGITNPLKSWNPVYANFAHYIDLFKSTRQSKSTLDTLKILFKRPGWLPEYLGGYQAPFEVEPDFKKFDRNTNHAINGYILTQFIVALIIIAAYFFKNSSFDPALKGYFTIWIIVTTLMFGFLFEYRKRWLSVVEIIRLVAIPFGIYLLSNSGFAIPQWLLFVCLIFAIGSIISFLKLLPENQISKKGIA